MLRMVIIAARRLDGKALLIGVAGGETYTAVVIGMEVDALYPVQEGGITKLHTVSEWVRLNKDTVRQTDLPPKIRNGLVKVFVTAAQNRFIHAVDQIIVDVFGKTDLYP